MRAWKKCSKRIAVLMLSVMCLLMGTGVTAFAYVDENAVAEQTEAPQTEAAPEETQPVVEETQNPEDTAFSVPGNGEVLDHITDGSSKEFYTIKTANNNTFYLVVDRSQTAQNVYMLSNIDENALTDFIEADETESAKQKEPAEVIPETEKVEETEPEKEEPKAANTNMGAMVLILLVAAVGIGAYYVIKIRPQKEEEDTDSENLEVGDGLETINEDEDDDFDEYDEE